MDNSTRRVADIDIHKGAKEEDRPGPERSSHPGLDTDGLPNVPIAIAQDALGAAAVAANLRANWWTTAAYTA